MSVAVATVTMPSLVFAAGFVNPLKDGLNTFSGFVEALLGAVVYIAFPIAVLFMVYSGFLFLFAQGNKDELATAKRNFLWTVIGVTLLLGAFALATLIKGTIEPLLR